MVNEAVILAAGLGSRLGDKNDEKPKEASGGDKKTTTDKKGATDKKAAEKKPSQKKRPEKK